MKKSLLLAALALPMFVSAKDPDLVNQPAPLPDFVSKVTPVQGLVDVSGDVCPLGVAEISFVFSGRDEVVPHSEVKSQLLKEGVVIGETETAYIDAMGVRVASLKFPGSRTQPGWCEVRVAEGQFTIGGVPNAAFNLFYQIDRFYNEIHPVPGVVDEVQDISIIFNGIDKLELNEAVYGDLTVLVNAGKETPEYQLTPQIVDEGDVKGVFIKMGQGDGIMDYFTEPGQYSVNVPAGMITTYVYGDNYAADPTDVVMRKNPRLNLIYTIPAFPQPSCEPENYATVQKLGKFVLTMEQGCDLNFGNDKVLSGIYAVNEDETIDSSLRLWPVMFTEALPEKGTIEFNVAEHKEVNGESQWVPVEVTPAPGEYAFVLAKNAFTATWTSATGAQLLFQSCAPFEYRFTVSNGETAVEEIEEAEADAYNVFNLQGIRVAKGISLEEVKALPAGLYIANGKKIMVK